MLQSISIIGGVGEGKGKKQERERERERDILDLQREITGREMIIENIITRIVLNDK